MSDVGKIEGDRLVELFQHLIEKRVIISMHMVGTDLDRLTCVTALKKSPEGDVLDIDLPNDFKSSVKPNGPLKLKFNFNGPDHLEYLFTTTGGQIGRREITVPLPPYVERIQRRKNFRMETPLGTKMFLKSGRVQAVFSLINISLGGAYGTLLKHNAKHTDGMILEIGETVDNLGIFVPAGKDWEELIIIIKQAEVRRIDHDRHHKKYKYAFEFMDLAASEKRKLTQSIYQFQRQFLQRR